MTLPRQQYDHLYLSPHFDDVALSCGGGVFRQTAIGDSVLVVTVTAAEPPAGLQSETVESLHRRWTDSLGGATVEAIVARRRAEDREAFDELRADVLHLPFLDCIYRLDPGGDPLYPGPTDMLGAFNSADAGLLDDVVGAFAALPPAGRVYAPLGVGGHVDHGVTRRAAERVFSDLDYYEDYPYTMAAGALEAVLPPEARVGWSAETVWLTESAMAAKIAAVAAYRSQLSSFFAGPEDLAARLREEGRRVLAETEAGGERAPAWAAGGERLWRRGTLSREFS
jgi:LmbE family N-acetylglucosaminyl deacetylase